MMIYTETFKPCLDYVLSVDEMERGRVNRAAAEAIYVGGKGVNVSLMLARLGQTSKALGFVGGFVGAQIRSLLEQQGVETDFVELQQGCSRINIKLYLPEETDVNARGPAAEAAAVSAFLRQLSRLQSGDTVVLAGSVLPNMERQIQEEIFKALPQGVRTVVDTTGTALIQALRYRPFLIKPNQYELGEVFEKTLTDEEEILFCARQLQQQGAQNVLVSLGERGALLLDETGGVHRCNAPSGRSVSAVGAGDSMVAGFLTGYARSGDYGEAFRLGVACGSATAFSERLGSAELVQQLYDEIKKEV